MPLQLSLEIERHGLCRDVLYGRCLYILFIQHKPAEVIGKVDHPFLLCGYVAQIRDV